MHNALAVTLRILRQFRRDPRTLFMMIAAPILAFFILDAIFGAPAYEPLVLTDKVPEDFATALVDAGAVVESAGREDALERLERGEADAFVTVDGATPQVTVEGTDPSKTVAVLRAVGRAQAASLVSLDLDVKPITLPGGVEIDIAQYLQIPDIEPPAEPVVTYLYGSADARPFDYYGPVFLGVFVFFFVFITSGISLVRERTGGTLARLLSMPIKRWELVLGYVIGFGVFTLIQSAIVTWASIYWVGFTNLGGFWLVLLVALSLSLVSLSLGILVSEFATTELQVMQLLQIIVIPQVLLSGMFDLSQTPAWMRLASVLFPLTYGAEAMRSVMLRGAGLGGIAPDLAVLWGFIIVLFAANVTALKKHRRI